jgi:hypothetical protein
MATKLISSTILVDPEEADKTNYALFAEFIHQATYTLGVKYIPCLPQTSACVTIVCVNSELRHRRSDANEHDGVAQRILGANIDNVTVDCGRALAFARLDATESPCK